MRRDGFFPPGLLVHRLSQGQIRAVSVSTQFCRSRNGSRRGKARRAYACMAKGFDEAWAHFCPSKPCLPLSIDVISISYPAALQDIMAIAEGESYEGFISGQLNPITCIYLYPAEDTTYSQDSIIAQIYWLLAEEKGPEASYGQCVTLATAKDGSRCICHLPMNVKLQYQTVENYNLDLWNIYNTIEQSLLNGEFTATLLGNN